MKPEAIVQTQIMQFLAYKKIYAYRINAGMLRVKGKQKDYMVKLAPAGFSDIVGVLPGGRALFIEVKAGKNKPTKLQKQFIKDMKEQGALALVAWSIEDVEKEFKKEGVIK